MNAIGVDLGGTNVRVALGDHEGNILRKNVERINITNGQQGITNQIIRMITAVTVHEEILGVGIGALGPLDMKQGMILTASHFPFNNITLKKPIEQAFKVPVHVINDCGAAVLGEKLYGLGHTIDNLAFITISSGIGCGAYVDGKLLLGKDGNASEMGHSIIDMTGALQCGCGKRGHWEAYCSGNNIPQFIEWWIHENHLQGDFKSSLLAEFSKGDFTNVSAKMVYEAAKRGDSLSLEIVDRLGQLNAIGVANVIAAYDPELITLGGSVTLNNQRLMLGSITQFVQSYAVNRIPEIAVTPLGHDIVLKGALAMIFNAY